MNKTSTKPLRNQLAAYCPMCERYTEQTRGRERGERHCWGCGNNFTLKESRAAAALESLTKKEGEDDTATDLR